MHRCHVILLILSAKYENKEYLVNLKLKKSLTALQKWSVIPFLCQHEVRTRLDSSVVVVAVCAQNQVPVRKEAGTDQRHGAARALEARLVPLPVLEGNVLPVSETCRTHGENLSLCLITFNPESVKI